MKRHIFFTGERGIGKSCAVNCVIDNLGMSVSGFLTEKIDLTDKLSRVFIYDAQRPTKIDKKN